MRQISFSRRHSIAESRKVPLNTIVLPPLTPPPQDNETALLGKVTVNKSKSGNVSGEIVLSRPPDVQKNGDQSPKGSDQVRISQLEQNIRFMQDQHQLMLAGLHEEIESLKNRNRELQFQLVFIKGPISSTSPSPSSPEDDTKHKLYSSPKILTNTTPLQVEIMEKELGELKIQMQELESRNVYLSAIVDEQKKKLERYERDREKEREQRANGQADEAELLRKLDDAEVLIRRLRRENSDLRRDSQSQGASGASAQHYNQAHHARDTNGYQSPRGSGYRGGNGRGHKSGNSGHNGHYRGGWFPPLHSQSFWQGGRQAERPHTQENATNLPSIPVTQDGSGTQQYHGRRGANNNHHYQNGDGRKYRGGHKGGKPS